MLLRAVNRVHGIPPATADTLPPSRLALPERERVRGPRELPELCYSTRVTLTRAVWGGSRGVWSLFTSWTANSWGPGFTKNDDQS